MIDFWSAVLWWDRWQLRILVLGSLALQWFLLVSAPMRKYTVPHWFRTFIWLAYISSDALAIYALATLFNRHARANTSCGYGGKASSLEVLWAPLLLVHLGGREEITAYNIEDNEMWTRQAVTLVSQVTAAVYAFCKSWPVDGDWRLLLSAIMLFVNGVINFCEKPWALRSASINRLVAMSSIVEGKRKKPGKWERCFTELDDRYKCWKELPRQPAPILSEMDRVQMILSDMSLLALTKELKDTRSKKGAEDAEDAEENRYLLKLDPGKRPEKQLNRWLRKAFELIYTRANVICSPAYIACNFMLVPTLYIAAIALFSVSNKQGYFATDVKMTYIFVCFTAALDVFGVLGGKLVYRLMSHARVPALCETLPEYNLVDSVLRRMNRATGWLLKRAARCGIREDYFLPPGRNSTVHVKVAEFIVTELMKIGQVVSLDVSSYRFLTKDNWALAPQGDVPKYLEDLRNSSSGGVTAILHSLSQESFDQSVLLWHIATDLCFRAMPPKHFHCRPPHPELLREVCTHAISNYMAHLLCYRPEMLMTGSRKHLLESAMRGMEALFHYFHKEKKLKYNTALDHGQMIREITEEGAKPENQRKYPLVHEACKLARELMALPADDDGKVDKRWKLMHDVWTGMLCYSASRCRGYLHAKSLGEGGEFLTFVWLVISLKGAKTLADQLQMSEEANADKHQIEKAKTKEAKAEEEAKAAATPHAAAAHSGLDEGEDLSKIFGL